MHVLIACDSFKDALPALEACRAVGRGARRAAPELDVRLFPLADGGEGTAGILTYHSQGKMIEIEVGDPLRRPIGARFGLSNDGRTAFIEMAAASGLPLLRPEERDPRLTSSYGTGELIRRAVRHGARRVLLGIGGSATNDAGTGMAAALGYRFLDADGRDVEPIGRNLLRIERIEDGNRLPALAETTVEVICDVDNPLYGPDGAAHVYGPQKGADAAAVAELDEGLRHFAAVMQRRFGRDFAAIPGAGAAGGMGAGAMAFLNARLRPGIETVMDYTNFEEALRQADLVITGEGKIDGQTLRGKLIHGICRRARTHGRPVVALCGALQASPDEIEAIGLRAAFSILSRPVDLSEALAETATGLEETAFNVIRLWLD